MPSQYIENNNRPIPAY